MNAGPRRLMAAGVFVVGALLIGAALFIDNTSLETFLGRSEGALSWGPSLFRSLLALHGALVMWAGYIASNRSWSGVIHAADAVACEVQEGSRQTTVLMALVSLTLIAVGLRLWHLNSCLWLDEVLTLVNYVRQPLTAIVTTFPDQNQHMLYSVLAHWSCQAFGESAWAVRLPAVMLGAASVPMLYALSRHFGSPRLEAFLASALLAVSYHHVWFSQNARGYSGLLFFSLLATWLFLRGLSGNSPTCWVGYSVAVALGMWMHMTMVFVVFSHAVVWLWDLAQALFHRTPSPFAPRAHGYPLAAFLLSVSLTIQLYALALPDFFSSALHEVSLPSAWTEPLWVVREMLAQMQIGLGGIIGLACGGLLFLCGLTSLGARDPRLVALFLLPGLSGACVMVVLQHNLWPRFFFFTLGFLILIAVRGAFVMGQLTAWLLRLDRDTGWARRLGPIAVLAMIGLSIYSLPRCYRVPKQDYVSAKVYVETQQKEGDGVVSVGLAALSYGLYFAPSWPTVETVEELARVRDTSQRLWLLYTFPPHMEAFCPDVWESVKKEFSLVKVFPGSLGGGEIYVCISDDS